MRPTRIWCRQWWKWVLIYWGNNWQKPRSRRLRTLCWSYPFRGPSTGWIYQCKLPHRQFFLTTSVGPYPQRHIDNEPGQLRWFITGIKCTLWRHCSYRWHSLWCHCFYGWAKNWQITKTRSALYLAPHRRPYCAKFGSLVEESRWIWIDFLSQGCNHFGVPTNINFGCWIFFFFFFLLVQAIEVKN